MTSNLPTNLIRLDVPITRNEDDCLDRAGITYAISKALIVRTEGKWRARGTAVGLVGRWGSGKSSVLNLLENHLHALHGVIVVRFDPWLFSNREDLISIFFNDLTRQIGRSHIAKARDVATAIAKYRGEIASAADAVAPGVGFLARLLPSFKKRSLRQSRDELIGRLNQFDGAIVVLIDEIDRIEVDEIKALAQFVKAILDFPNISYVLSYDLQRVIAALEHENVQNGEEYLKKIVQINVPIRDIFDYEAQNLIKSTSSPDLWSALESEGERFSQVMPEILKIVKTPRDIKRASATAEIFFGSNREEISAVDLFSYACVSSFSSQVAEAIKNNFDNIVVDPVFSSTDWADIFRDRDQGKPKSVIERLKLDETKFGLFENLLRILFPIERDRGELRKFGRLCERKNLLMLLYFGNPPFRVSRAKVLGFWQNPRQDFLRELLRAGILADFVSQIELLLSELPSDGDPRAFVELSSFLTGGDFERRFQVKDAIDGVRWSLARLAQVNERNMDRVRNIFLALIASGELLISSGLIRHHMFAFGMAGNEGRAEYEVFFGKEEFTQILYQELVRYRTEIESGAWLDGHAGTEIVYAVLQGGLWDEDVRAAVSKQVSDSETALRFCSLLTPPGYSLERGTLELLVDGAVLKAALDLAETTDELLAASRGRMLGVIDGRAWHNLD